MILDSSPLSSFFWQVGQVKHFHSFRQSQGFSERMIKSGNKASTAALRGWKESFILFFSNTDTERDHKLLQWYPCRSQYFSGWWMFVTASMRRGDEGEIGGEEKHGQVSPLPSINWPIINLMEGNCISFSLIFLWSKGSSLANEAITFKISLQSRISHYSFKSLGLKYICHASNMGTRSIKLYYIYLILHLNSFNHSISKYIAT